MTINRHTLSSDSESYIPPKTFTVERLGKTVDLTTLLADGAKHTVIYSAFAKALGIPAKIPSRRKNDPLKIYASHSDYLYRALNRFVSQGLLEKYTGIIDSQSVEPMQRKGLFWRASEAARQIKPNLIRFWEVNKTDVLILRYNEP